MISFNRYQRTILLWRILCQAYFPENPPPLHGFKKAMQHIDCAGEIIISRLVNLIHMMCADPFFTLRLRNRPKALLAKIAQAFIAWPYETLEWLKQYGTTCGASTTKSTLQAQLPLNEMQMCPRVVAMAICQI